MDSLIREHASIDRALIQILMPRMSEEELREIIERALASLGMKMNSDDIKLVVTLSQGLPHYAHLLGKQSTMAAIDRNSLAISENDLQKGIEDALSDCQRSVQSAYQEAVASPQKKTIFREVLLACALAKADERGYFAAADVRRPLNVVTGKNYTIQSYSPHLDKFCNEVARGKVLEKVGQRRRYRFRFRDPLLQPYVIMKGLLDTTLKGGLLDLVRGARG